MENKEKLKSKARKLKALADRGVEGEKQNAQRRYEEFIKKHKLDESEIDPQLNNRRFRVKNYDDLLILNNVILSVNPFTKINNNELFLDVDLDDEDFREVKEKFKYFIKLFKVEKELLTMAFFSKHQKFFSPDDNAKNKWRESRAENEELKKARENAEKIDKKAKKNGESDLSKEQIEKLKKDSQIQTLNMSRLDKIIPILLDGKYVRNNQTIEEKK